MLEMRPDCQGCGRDLPPASPDAHICSFECTYCAQCAQAASAICPNCGGVLVARPTRAEALLDRYPAATERRFRG
jgi:hypothetical protein